MTVYGPARDLSALVLQDDGAGSTPPASVEPNDEWMNTETGVCHIRGYDGQWHKVEPA